MPASGLSMEYQVSIIRRIEGGQGGAMWPPEKNQSDPPRPKPNTTYGSHPSSINNWGTFMS